MPDDAEPTSEAESDEPVWDLAATAHEIRAPLLAVRAALETVRDGGEVVAHRRLLEGALAEVGRLAASVEDLLAWAVGPRPLRRAQVDLGALVRDVVGRVELAAEDVAVVLRSDEPVIAAVDRTWLEVAVANLLRNALAYRRAGTPVEVAVEGTGDGGAEISVRNHGALRAALPLENVFETAPGDPDARRPGGRGLGLPIARRIVEAHGGRLRLDAEDDRTRFVIRLGGAPA